MNFLVIGSGGREHTFAWKLKQSTLCDKLYIAPGNGGTGNEGINVAIAETDFDALAKFSLENSIDIILVGPEAPLVEGIYDYFKQKNELKHIHVIGPSKAGAMLEGSKLFAKEFMYKHNIPTAAYKEFTLSNLQEGFEFIDSNEPPFVLKADGLAAGKGVVILQNREDAKKELNEMIADAKFGKASARVLIEQFLDGVEFSVFVLTDGKNYSILPQAKDYKRIGVGDTGLNTGGMGAVSPVPFITPKLMNDIENQVIKRTIEGLISDGIVYKGFIYFGFILCKGVPYIIEYNCRMGDPETEVVIPRINNDFGEMLLKCGENKLNDLQIKHSNETGATVVVVSGGYPEDYEKGKIINFPPHSESLIFHAGTIVKNGKTLTNGGRVLAITSFGSSVQEAVNKSKTVAAQIDFEGKYFRNDIGYEFE